MINSVSSAIFVAFARLLLIIGNQCLSLEQFDGNGRKVILKFDSALLSGRTILLISVKTAMLRIRDTI